MNDQVIISFGYLTIDPAGRWTAAVQTGGHGTDRERHLAV